MLSDKTFFIIEKRVQFWHHPNRKKLLISKIMLLFQINIQTRNPKYCPLARLTAHSLSIDIRKNILIKKNHGCLNQKTAIHPLLVHAFDCCTLHVIGMYFVYYIFENYILCKYPLNDKFISYAALLYKIEIKIYEKKY